MCYSLLCFRNYLFSKQGQLSVEMRIGRQGAKACKRTIILDSHSAKLQV